MEKSSPVPPAVMLGLSQCSNGFAINLGNKRARIFEKSECHVASLYITDAPIDFDDRDWCCSLEVE
ncbi:hypothetical protein FRC03_004610 [Tulasnella sp. 419]|nr:hypothetical protein FRC03_004610 [Tulasnella sp. 419]